MRALTLITLLLALTGGTEGRDFLPLDHGLRYVGHEGRIPVTVEITLREKLGGELEYTRWVTPRSWATWFRNASRSCSTLVYEDERLRPTGYDAGAGPRSPPADLPQGALDELAVRLRARSDIARGLRQAEYPVWREDGSLENWWLEVMEAETVSTPNGNYESLKFRLGTQTEWLEGWSAPLLVFHFVKLVHWRDGHKVGELLLDEKQL
jgi:hypothetical protein